MPAGRPHRQLLAVLVLIGIVCQGCAAYQVTHRLEGPVHQPATFRIGPIEDMLPDSVDPEYHPTISDLDKLEEALYDELAGSGLFDAEDSDVSPQRYEVSGTILEYEERSSLLRFLGLGKAKVIMELRLSDVSSGAVAFAGNFKGVVTGKLAPNEWMFNDVAEHFVGHLKRHQLRYLRHKKS